MNEDLVLAKTQHESEIVVNQLLKTDPTRPEESHIWLLWNHVCLLVEIPCGAAGQTGMTCYCWATIRFWTWIEMVWFKSRARHSGGGNRYTLPSRRRTGLSVFQSCGTGLTCYWNELLADSSCPVALLFLVYTNCCGVLGSLCRFCSAMRDRNKLRRPDRRRWLLSLDCGRDESGAYHDLYGQWKKGSGLAWEGSGLYWEVYL